jgi:hypothetical protein
LRSFFENFAEKIRDMELSFLAVLRAFLRVVSEKTGVWRWSFDGEIVVNCVVNCGRKHLLIGS